MPLYGRLLVVRAVDSPRNRSQVLVSDPNANRDRASDLCARVLRSGPRRKVPSPTNYSRSPVLPSGDVRLSIW